MERPVNIFDNKNVRDYNKHATLNALRNNCVRAVELDDRQGTKKKGTYLLAMKLVADGIYQELGIKTTKSKSDKTKKVVVKDSDEYKELESLLTNTQTRSKEQEVELEELDKDVETKDKEISELKAKLSTPLDTSEMDAIGQSLKISEAKNKKLTADNNKLLSKNKKLTKGAK